MRTYYEKAKTLATSGTAKDTYLMFFGNAASAFLGFLFTLIVARSLSIGDFGVFSAANNLILIIISITDLGISAGMINFVSSNHSNNDLVKMKEYIKAGFTIRLTVVSFLALTTVIFAPYIAKTLLASQDASISIWVAVILFGMFVWLFFPFVFQGQKRFVASVTTELSLSLTRTLLVAFFALGGLTIYKAFGAYALSGVAVLISVKYLLGFDFLKTKPSREIYKKLMSFSGWLGLNTVISSISGRLDVQMMASMLGATATGLYSVPSRLSMFIGVLSGSFMSVISPRLASFNDRNKEKTFILKAYLALIPVVAGIIFWIIIAEPFIVILFSEKYRPAVPIFRMLSLAMIPFILTSPSVSAIIYALKKPFYIGYFSFFQIIAMFILNLLFIPKFGAIGPTISIGIVNTLLLLYTGFIVFKHYWLK